MFETIISGVTIFVTGQLIIKLVIEPVHALKTAFAEVSQGLLINAPFIYNPSAINDTQRNIVKERMLALSGQVRAKLMLVPAYQFWRHVFFLPKEARVHEAAQNLVAIGNWVYSNSSATAEHIIKNVQSASDILGIYIPPNSRVSEELLNAAIENSFGRQAVAQRGAQADLPSSSGLA
jgi:hypothetical protein